MDISVHTNTNTGYLSHPGDPDGRGDMYTSVTIADDSDENDEWNLRLEVCCKDEAIPSSDANDYGWYKCSVQLSLTSAKTLHAALGLMLAQAESEA